MKESYPDTAVLVYEWFSLLATLYVASDKCVNPVDPQEHVHVTFRVFDDDLAADFVRRSKDVAMPYLRHVKVSGRDHDHIFAIDLAQLSRVCICMKYGMRESPLVEESPIQEDDPNRASSLLVALL